MNFELSARIVSRKVCRGCVHAAASGCRAASAAASWSCVAGSGVGLALDHDDLAFYCADRLGVALGFLFDLADTILCLSDVLWFLVMRLSWS